MIYALLLDGVAANKREPDVARAHKKNEPRRRFSARAFFFRLKQAHVQAPIVFITFCIFILHFISNLVKIIVSIYSMEVEEIFSEPKKLSL